MRDTWPLIIVAAIALVSIDARAESEAHERRANDLSGQIMSPF